MPIRLLLAFVAAFFAATPAAAWWDYGHETIAEIAMRSVKSSTRAQVRRLLRHSAELGTAGCPASTLAEASNWADCADRDPRFRHTGPWHYQNVDVCRPFERASPCKDGNCVSAQVERQAKLLADRSLPDVERLQALAFLIHFVGDLHEPMHSADRNDRGGNRLRADYGLIGGRTNLHLMWDGYVAERAISAPPGGPTGLLSSLNRDERRKLAAGTVEEWSRESWQVARDLSYTGLLGEPCGPLPFARPVLREDAVRAAIPAVRRQVLAGGLRLARLLGEALASPASQR